MSKVDKLVDKLKFNDTELDTYLQMCFDIARENKTFRDECNVELKKLKGKPHFKLRNALLKVLIRNLLRKMRELDEQGVL